MPSDHPSNRSGVTTGRRTRARAFRLEIRAEATPFPLAPFLFWLSCILVAPFHSFQFKAWPAGTLEIQGPSMSAGWGRAPNWWHSKGLQASDTRHNGGDCAERGRDF